MKVQPSNFPLAEPISVLILYVREIERRFVGARHQRQSEVGHLHLESGKIRTRYANYLKRLPVQQQRSANDILVSGQTLPPAIVAQDYHRISPFHAILLLGEESSESHTAAEHGQIVVGSEYPFNLYRRDSLALFSQQKILFKSGEDVWEGLRVITIINIFEVRKIAAAIFVLAFDFHYGARIFYRRRAQKEVEARKERGVDANTKP